MAILIDSYSKIPVVETIRSTAFPDIRTGLKKVFALLGIPDVLDFDNRPTLQGHAFRDYLVSLGVMYSRRT